MTGLDRLQTARPRRESFSRIAEGLARTVWGVPRAVWLLVLVAFFFRLLALWVFRGPDLVSASESGLTAANWVARRGYTFDFYGYRAASPLQSFMPPLFTTIIAACLLSPWPEALFGALQVLLSSLTVLLVYLIAVEVSDRTVGLVAAALTAVYPPFLILLNQRTVSVLIAFLLGVWLWLSMKLIRTLDLKWAVLAGLALGLTVLSRPSFLGLLAVLVFAICLTWRDRGGSWWRVSTVVVGIVSLTIAPWLVRNWAVHGRFVFISTNGGVTFWNGNNPFTTGSAHDVVVPDLVAYSGEAVAAPEGATFVMITPYPLPLELRDTVGVLDEVALDRALYRSALTFIRQQPRHWFRLLAQKLVSLWWFRPNIGRSGGSYEEAWILPYKILYITVLIPTVAGLILSVRRWRRYLLPYGAFAYLTVVYVAYNVITRYRWEMKSYLLIFAALALVRAGRWLVERSVRSRWA